MIANFLATMTGKLIAGAIVIGLLLLLYWYLSWDDNAQFKQNSRSANATAETAIESAQVIIDRSQGDKSIDELVAETSKEIDNAETPKAAGDAARAAVCKLLDAGNDPACKLH